MLRRADRVGLVAGVTFATLAVLLLLDELGALELRLAAVLPVVLIAAGLALLLAGLGARR